MGRKVNRTRQSPSTSPPEAVEAQAPIPAPYSTAAPGGLSSAAAPELGRVGPATPPIMLTLGALTATSSDPRLLLLRTGPL
mmetsp:Transcript_19627/g.59376  ORF Transcript_19627/g.59376 Transcript_19627/m.59376 type:complete len:81 (-) Transcript_19627:54-296(-)